MNPIDFQDIVYKRREGSQENSERNIRTERKQGTAKANTVPV